MTLQNEIPIPIKKVPKYKKITELKKRRHNPKNKIVNPVNKDKSLEILLLINEAIGENIAKAKRGRLVITPASKLDNPISFFIKLTKGPTDVIDGLRLKAAIIIANPRIN